MKDVLLGLSEQELRLLASEVRSCRLGPPFPRESLGRYLIPGMAASVSGLFQRLHEEGLAPEHLALLLESIADERERGRRLSDTVDLVITGPEPPGSAIRDTAVVVRELFTAARERVLVVGYAVYQGKTVFQELARRMDAAPDLEVDMCLDIKRAAGDTSLDADIVRRFAADFRKREWPGLRLPRVYYDPRSLDHQSSVRASLHAKCVVVDREVAFVSSANFTEAAQARNIEVGVLVRSRPFAAKLAGHFEGLVGRGMLRGVAGV